MSFNIEELRSAVAEHGEVVRVVVAAVAGSTPRNVGASMLVWDGGQTGTIGGGRLELDASAAAAKSLKGANWVRTFSLGPELGQCCGGTVTVLAERYDKAKLKDIPSNLWIRHVEGHAEEPLQFKRAAALSEVTSGFPQTELKGGWFLEPIQNAGRKIWLYGAGHVGRAIVKVLSDLPDFQITWVDVAEDRFPKEIPPNTNKFVAKNIADAVKHAPDTAEHLILTYSHGLDLELCHQILGRNFSSAGLIGSKTKWARFRSRLAQLGHADSQISRINCPIGQPELGKHPQAIAVGVAATLMSLVGRDDSLSELVG